MVRLITRPVKRSSSHTLTHMGVQYFLSPGLKSDILCGNYLSHRQQPPASSHIVRTSHKWYACIASALLQSRKTYYIICQALCQAFFRDFLRFFWIFFVKNHQAFSRTLNRVFLLYFTAFLPKNQVKNLRFNHIFYIRFSLLTRNTRLCGRIILVN